VKIEINSSLKFWFNSILQL